ncbi:MAG TPA: hypothetical protein VFA26_14920 [Gemmataceae bacterium]|nr:hypothetical protein [Gemmataceae bacterium]
MPSLLPRFLRPAARTARPAPRKPLLGVESLEERLLMHGGAPDALPMPVPLNAATPALVQTDSSAGISVSSIIAKASPALSSIVTSSSSSALLPKSTRDVLMGLPALDSNPGAKATIYLDFTGNYERSWFQYDDSGKKVTYSNVSTPAFDTDGDPTKFSPAEQAQIKEIWARVAEDYAPFNVNVSTDYYGSFNNGQALHVVIGGSSQDWLKLKNSDGTPKYVSGTSSIGSFSDDAPNEVFVFSKDIAGWTTDSYGQSIEVKSAVATTISHESGHAFGLHHYETFNADGSVKQTYYAGTGNWTPIMGNNLSPNRTTWAYAQTGDIHYSLPFGGNINIPVYEDEMAVIAGSQNGFGYRADDHGDYFSNATPLTVKNVARSQLGGSGIIEKTTDVDVFSFSTKAGYVSVRVDPAQYGANLMPKVELWSAQGIVASADPANGSAATLSATLKAGTYYVRVMSHGDYGDVGQYSVTVTVPSWLRIPFPTGASKFIPLPGATSQVPPSIVGGSAPALVAALGRGASGTTAVHSAALLVFGSAGQTSTAKAVVAPVVTQTQPAHAVHGRSVFGPGHDPWTIRPAWFDEADLGHWHAVR